MLDGNGEYFVSSRRLENMGGYTPPTTSANATLEIKMQGYYRQIPEYIARHKSLSAEESLFWGLVFSLTNHLGFCWATNVYLADAAGKDIRTIQRYIRKFTRLNLLIVEHNCDTPSGRKIWLPETYAARENIQKNLIDNQKHKNRDKFNQNTTGGDTDVMGGVTCVSSSPTTPNKENRIIIYNKKTHRGFATAPPSENFLNKKNKDKDKDKWKKKVESKPIDLEQKNQPQEPKDGIPTLPPEMTAGAPPPTPGPAQMVKEVKALLSSPIKMGNSRFFIHQNDREYFWGFSPAVIEKAIGVMHKDSKYGTRISKPVRYLFSLCAKIIKERG